MDTILWTILAAILALNVAASVRIGGNANLAPQMRRWQWLLVWLLPVCGAIVTLLARVALDAETSSDPAAGKHDPEAGEFMAHVPAAGNAEIAAVFGGDD